MKKNVLFIIMIVSIFGLSGCQTLQKIIPLTSVKKIKLLDPPLPTELILKEVKFQVLNMKRLREISQNTKTGDKKVVFIVLTVNGYENLSLNIAEIKRYLEELKEVVKSYRKQNNSS